MAHEFNESAAMVETLTPKLVTRRFTDIQREYVTWMWHGIIPCGKLIIIDGSPGTGKSTLTADIAAKVSSGQAFPCGTVNPPRGVLFIAVEDGFGDTVKPRVQAAEANCALIYSAEGVTAGGVDSMIDLSRNIDLIREKIIQDDIALVIIDPLMALLGGSVDSHRDQDIRSITSPLAKLAEETNTTILMVRHPNKNQGGSAIMRGGGSIGIIGAARVGLTLGKDPEDDDKRVLAVAKNNLAKDNRSFSFQIVNDETFGTGRIEWLGISSVTADDLYREPNRGERTQIEEAMDLIRDILKDGRLGSKEIFSIAKNAGISETPVRDAMKRLKLVHEREGFGLGTRTYWSFKLSDATHSLPEKAMSEVMSDPDGNEWSNETMLTADDPLKNEGNPWAK